MRAVTITSFGSPDGLALAEIPEPTPGLDEVLVRVDVAGVSGFDTLVRSGALAYPGVRTGHVPGIEVAGTVESVGAHVNPALLGRRVWAFTGVGGGYAEQVAVASSAVVPLEDDLSSMDAVAIGVSAPVAYFALEQAHLRSGDQVLIRGASGSIGIAAVELARQAGCAVTVTTGSSARGQRLRELGASHVVDRNGEGRGPDGYDVVLDLVGGEDVQKFLERLSPNGRYVLAGAIAGWPDPGFGTHLLQAFQKSLTFGTLSLDSINPERLDTVRTEMFQKVVRNTLTPAVEGVLSLAEAAEAHRRMDSGAVFGRIVLSI
ncbi:zinc-binding dehydrogenase [Plantibacter sp. VKM Ac-2876]|uniref:zinc-binding dehydrogenase n=1 Tax=Plantibacter sp. VKM Ac-2876 TaxID=2783826 RepID=UPI00188D3778|nr:zinc-binding dehydrogenase [Plantibacter sp. VKM Ac-2876]MBF4563980.1 zinc-binding dehydrogenase [Plantibacter sp. VKM Ac-2876]